MKPAIALLLLATVAFALVPGDLHNEDSLVTALFHTEPFQGNDSRVPNTSEDARAKLQSLIAANPARADLEQALAEVDSNRGDFVSAEKDLLAFVEKNKNKSQAYVALETFYHQRLRFEDELHAMEKHAEALPVHKDDVAFSRGRYALYRKIAQHIEKYRLISDARSAYEAAITSYPDQLQPYLDYVQYLKTNDPKGARESVERIRTQFPGQTSAYLLTKASLLSNDDAFDLLNQAFDPLWSEDLIHAFDSRLTASGHKRDYLKSMQEKLQKNPLDLDAVARLFYAYHLAGNPMEAQNTLNDFRLLKEQQVRAKQSTWSAKELFLMAKLNEKLVNYNETARYYYALYSLLSYKKQPDLTADLALHGLFETILAAEDRPIQLSAGSLDYYKDIAKMDTDPGILNGILSMLFNSNDPASEWQGQQDKAVGYFNRAEALRLVRLTQKLYPQSAYLPAMYRDALKVYEKYGMDQLIVDAGEEYFRNYRNAPEILDVGIAVTDAYARMQNHQKEWETYQFLLPIAAQLSADSSLFQQEPEIDNPESEGDEQAQPPAKQQKVDYQYLLNRYIASLTAEHNNLEVVKLYKAEIAAHPDEQSLYENFANYLAQNQLFDEERTVYQHAIDRFQEKSWYEKLARWYLRKERNDEYEALSRKIMDIFQGTEIESYLQDTMTGPETLHYALNLYAHQRFPLNLKFVQNLLGYYATQRQWNDWQHLAAEYYFLDNNIRQDYLAYLSRNGKLPKAFDETNPINTRFQADVEAWRSHFEEATEQYKEISKIYPSDPEINIRLADLQRSLGVQNIQNYFDSAATRERLAKLNPSDSTIWTNAGETLADIEQYGDAGKYWNEILKIDPYNPDRFIEVATIYWDYYLFDDALNTIGKIRSLQKNDSLFAYEAGAIYESKRDYPRAIDEYAKSLADHSDLAWNRLGELYGRKKYMAMIRNEIESQLQKNLQDEKIWSGTIGFYAYQQERDVVRSLLTRAMQTLQPEHFERLAPMLKQTSSDLGFSDLQAQLIQRQIKDAQEDLGRWNRMLELARFYEGSKKQSDAETIYRDLYSKQPRSAGVIQELTSYYWRTGQYNKAFSVYQDALSHSNANWRKKYLLETANRYRERKDDASALIAARELLSGDPLNSQYFQLVAEILAEQNDFAGLNAHYKEGLKRVAESQLSADEKKGRIAQLRHGIIQANVILKDYTAALDQYIEIINRDAENEEGLKEAADFASRYGLTQRLFDYYAKTAAASPKDHRWPMVLGRLNLYSGNFDQAIQQFQTAILIRPERTDFYEQVAKTYQRLGKYPEALAQYQKAYELSFKSAGWLTPIAELHAAMGHKKEALQAWDESLKDYKPMEKQFAMCGQALNWGFVPEALTYCKTGFDQYYRDMGQPYPFYGTEHYTEALLKTQASRRQAFLFMVSLSDRISNDLTSATFDTETLRSAQYQVDQYFASGFPNLLKIYYTTEDWDALDAAIFEQSTKYGLRNHLISNFLSLVRQAQMAPAEEKLLQNLVIDYRSRLGKPGDSSDWSQYLQYRSELTSFYTKRQEYARGASWMESDYLKNPRNYDYRDELITIGRLYRLGEQTDNEIRALRMYYEYGSRYELQPEPVNRYLDLLYSKSATDEIKKAAANPNLIAINYFFEHKDKPMATLAIESFGRLKNTQPQWSTTQLAMLGWQLRDASDFFDTKFKTALDLRTIGELLVPERDITETLEGNDWFYYGSKYGQYLYWISNPVSSEFLNSDLEGLPTGADRQDELGSFYTQEKQFEKALDHYELALQLASTNMQYIDHKARALMALNKRQEAIDVWKNLVAKADERDAGVAWSMTLQAAAEFTFIDDLRKDAEAFLADRIAKSGEFNLATLYLRNTPERSGVELISKWVPDAPAPAQFGRALLRADFGDAINRQIFTVVNRYLESRLSSAAGNEQSTVKSEWWQWNQTYINSLVSSKDYDQALQVIATASERFEAPEEQGRREEIALLKAKVLAETGRYPASLQTLQEYVKPKSETEESYERQDRYKKALQAVEGYAEVELPLNEEMYTWILSDGDTSDSTYAGLAEVKLKKGESAEANELLRKMIYLNGENLQGFVVAAELREKFKQWQEAIDLRQERARRRPWDQTNRATLANDLLELNRKADAAAAAKPILLSPSAQAKDRALAAFVYGKTTSTEIGPPEMIAIERTARGTTQQASAYAWHLRAAILKQNTEPPSALVQAQFFLNPDSSDLKVDLFYAFARENKCEQALELIDAGRQRLSGYALRSEIQDYGEEYDYGYNYPLESLNLGETETHDLAGIAADCAKKTEDPQGQIFFLKMASAHTKDAAEKESILKTIADLQKAQEKQQEKQAHNYHVGLNLGRANQ